LSQNPYLIFSLSLLSTSLQVISTTQSQRVSPPHLGYRIGSEDHRFSSIVKL